MESPHVCEPHSNTQFSSNPDNLKCPDCKCSCDVSIVSNEDGADIYECAICGEEWYANGTVLVTKGEYYESVCESREAARDEEYVFGSPDRDYPPDPVVFRDDYWERDDDGEEEDDDDEDQVDQAAI